MSRKVKVKTGADAAKYTAEALRIVTEKFGVQTQCYSFNKFARSYISDVIPSTARNLKISPFGQNDSMEGVDVDSIGYTHDHAA